MANKPDYRDFTVASPWTGTIHAFIKDGKFYKEPGVCIPTVIEVTQPREIHQKAYDALYRAACRIAGMFE